MSDRSDLDLILAGHFPLVTIATGEEPRVIELVRAAARRMDLSLSQWTVTDGLVVVTGNAFFHADQLRLADAAAAAAPSPTTRDAETALRTIRNSRQPGMVLLLDFHPFLDDPVNVRLLKEIAQDYDLRRQKLVFVSHALSLPLELARHAASFTLSIPSNIELARLVAEEAEIWALRGDRSKVRADQEAVAALVNNLGGLTRSDARRLVRNAIHDDGAITASDVAAVAAAKYALIGQDGLLAFEFDTAQLADVGGLDHLKRWLAARGPAFKRADGGRDRPKGVLLLGVQGGGKSLAAKAVPASGRCRCCGSISACSTTNFPARPSAICAAR